MKITKISDYVDKVLEKFPQLPPDEIRRILVYGWKLVILYRSAGNDISITSPKTFFFIGKIPKNPLKRFEHYYKQLARRINYMFRRTKSKWDGYYYFTRSENQYNEYLKLSKKKYKVFKDVYLYKLLEELRVVEPYLPYIFRLDEDRTSWYKKYYPEIRTDKAELIITRDPMNMNDLKVSLNKYKYIQY